MWRFVVLDGLSCCFRRSSGDELAACLWLVFQNLLSLLCKLIQDWLLAIATWFILFNLIVWLAQTAIVCWERSESLVLCTLERGGRVWHLYTWKKGSILVPGRGGIFAPGEGKESSTFVHLGEGWYFCAWERGRVVLIHRGKRGKRERVAKYIKFTFVVFYFLISF